MSTTHRRRALAVAGLSAAVLGLDVRPAAAVQPVTALRATRNWTATIVIRDELDGGAAVAASCRGAGIDSPDTRTMATPDGQVTEGMLRDFPCRPPGFEVWARVYYRGKQTYAGTSQLQHTFRAAWGSQRSSTQLACGSTAPGRASRLSGTPTAPFPLEWARGSTSHSFTVTCSGGPGIYTVQFITSFEEAWGAS